VIANVKVLFSRSNRVPVASSYQSMRETTHTAACERARAWAALAPDGELSRFELRLLAAHLDHCGTCAEFARHVAGVTSLLRAQPLEPPDLTVHVGSVRRRSARRLRGPLVSAAASAAAVLATVSVVSTANLAPSRSQRSQPRPLVLFVQPADDGEETRELRQLRRAELLGGTQPQEEDRRSGVQPL
jgi:hypothetical protein